MCYFVGLAVYSIPGKFTAVLRFNLPRGPNIHFSSVILSTLFCAGPVKHLNYVSFVMGWERFLC